jgi:hypothetical protein
MGQSNDVTNKELAKLAEGAYLYRQNEQLKSLVEYAKRVLGPEFMENPGGCFCRSFADLPDIQLAYPSDEIALMYGIITELAKIKEK